MTKRVKTQKAQEHRLEEIHTTAVDWKNRTIWIVGEIDEERGYRYVPAIRLLDETPGPIKVIIMSNGGCEPAGFAIFDTLLTLKNQVITIGFGHVYSIAALIFQAGGQRLLSNNCELMMHNGTLGLEGGDIDTDMIEKIAAEASKNNGRYHRAIAQRSGVDLQSLRQWCKDERYFSASEAITEGLADGLVADWRDVT